jgi:hypothetical protein
VTVLIQNLSDVQLSTIFVAFFMSLVMNMAFSLRIYNLRAEGMAQVVEYLLCKCETLSSRELPKKKIISKKNTQPVNESSF